MKLKLFLLLICLLGLIFFSASSVFSPNFIKPIEKQQFSIGWVGDMVPAGNESFNINGLNYVKDLTQEPSFMMGNLEGTFAKEDRVSKCSYIPTKCHAFRSGTSFAYALKDAGFDFISLVNNHSYDYGDEGLSDTEEVLKSFGIPFISPTKPSTIVVVENKRIGILGVSSTPPKSTITNYSFIKEEIEKLKEDSDIVILVFHGGSEGSDKTIVTGEYEYLGTENRGNVLLVAQTAIDAGADIVLGSGPHVLRKVSYYKNKPIIFSAGNFFGGNERLTTSGNLGISAVFTLTEKNNSFVNNLTSILLTKSGIPYPDPTNKAFYLLESLAN
ncbi:MAG: CapA family protein [Candidatus Pacebacteria bacterium]|nr:CapA family protein [Candidatus Paceibacterota bacterium]